MARFVNDLKQYVEMLSAGLAGRTAHMRSAAVLSLARVIFEFGASDPELRGTIPGLLTTVLCLMREQAREVVKSVVSFMRIAVAVCDPEVNHASSITKLRA